MPKSATFLTLAVAAMATSAIATPPPEPPRIVIVGHGAIKSDPDVASLTFSIRGEGISSDAAATELGGVDKFVAVDAGQCSLVP